jgi:hypothetical protein
VSRPLASLLAVGAVLAQAAAAPAQRRPEGQLVHAEGRELRRRPLAGGEWTTLAALPVDAAQVRRIEVAGDGSALLVDLGGPALWLDLAGATPESVLLPCRAAARLSRAGGQVACAARGGQALFHLRPAAAAILVPGGGPDPAGLAGAAGEALIAVEGDAVVRRQPGADDVRLADAPDGDLSVAPAGERAVGRFGDALHTFRLDGVATRRKLLPGTPVAWSADGGWLLVDTEAAACVVRAIGGEYKCWDGYRGQALDAGGRRVLLARDDPAGGGGVELSHAPVGGAHSAPPVPLGPAIGAAALLP